MLLSWAKFPFLASEDRRELWFPVPCNQDRKLFLSGHEPWELCPHFRSERVLRKLILPLKRDNLDLTSSINEFLEELTLCWYICGCFLLYLELFISILSQLFSPHALFGILLEELLKDSGLVHLLLKALTTFKWFWHKPYKPGIT